MPNFCINPPCAASSSASLTMTCLWNVLELSSSLALTQGSEQSGSGRLRSDLTPCIISFSCSVNSHSASGWVRHSAELSGIRLGVDGVSPRAGLIEVWPGPTGVKFTPLKTAEACRFSEETQHGLKTDAPFVWITGGGRPGRDFLYDRDVYLHPTTAPSNMIHKQEQHLQRLKTDCSLMEIQD